MSSSGTASGAEVIVYLVVMILALFGGCMYWGKTIDCDSKCPAGKMGTITPSLRCVCMERVAR